MRHTHDAASASARIQASDRDHAAQPPGGQVEVFEEEVCQGDGIVGGSGPRGYPAGGGGG